MNLLRLGARGGAVAAAALEAVGVEHDANRDRRTPVPIPARARVLAWLLVVIAAGAAVGASLAGATRHTHWGTFAALCAAAATAQLFGVRTTRNQSYHLAITFVVAGAFLLPPPLLVLVCFVQHAAEWVKERYPLEMQAFNLANYTIAALATWAIADLVVGPRNPSPDARTALAGLAAAAAFVLVNHVVLAGMLRVARGHSFRESGLFGPESLSTDVVLAVIGVGLAAWWSRSFAFVPVAIAPLALIWRALSVPRLRAQASLDSKTGLYNAGHLDAALQQELERAGRFGRPLSVVIADLDFLREINNTHGHLAGDAVLRGVADAFRELLRPYDVAARFGGEEFAALLPETTLEDAVDVAERIRARVEAASFRRDPADEPLRATISIGVASFPLHADEPDELLHQADLALYRAKGLGRNKICTATSSQPARPAPTPASMPYALDDARPATTAVAPVRPVRTATPPARHVGPTVWAVILPLLIGALALLGHGAGGLDGIVDRHATGLAGFAAVVVCLQLLSVDLYGSGGESASAVGILAAGFALGVPAAMTVAMLAALVQWLRKRAPLSHGLFDVAMYTLAACASGQVYATVESAGASTGIRLAGAVAAATTYRIVNVGLLCLIMSVAERLPFRTIWSERFRWASLHYLAHAPLAFAFALAYEKMGLVGLAAFAVPPVLATFSVRQYVGHTRASVEEVRHANDELRRSYAQLDRSYAELEESNQRVRKTHLATIAALSRSIEAKDRYTGGHTERVGTLAVAIAERFGFVGEDLEAIETGALLHDIGKLGIPESVLNKPGPLTDDEWVTMREHPLISDYILSDIDLHPFVRQIVRSSHERLDGTGYPDGCAGDEIPLAARIVLVADAFDALTSDRSYRPGRSAAVAFKELEKHAGTQFCPLCVDALRQLWRERPELFADEPRLEPLNAVA